MGIDEFVTVKTRKEAWEDDCRMSVIILLEHTDFSVKKIAEIHKVSLSFVSKVKKSLAKK